MEEIQILEAVEKYIRGEMTEEEKFHFEQLRKSSPELDQLVVEHSMFFHQLGEFGDWKNYRNSLHDIHNQLIVSGEIREEAPKAVVRELWRKYKRVMAVAASIAGLTTLLVASVATYYTRQATKKQVEELSRQVKAEVDQKTTRVIHELDKRAPLIPEKAKISGGTGFLIDAKGYLVTNAHVIKTSVVVQNNKNQQFLARVIYVNRESDIAVIKIEDTSFKAAGPLPYAIRSSNVDLGESLFTLGYPREEIVYNEGYMSAKTGYDGDTLTCQIGVSANPGNSGGPVFNKNGEIIGIVTTRQSQAENVVFAITAKNIFRTVEDIKKEDSALKTLKIPLLSSIKGMDRTQQIKKIEDCVFMIKSY